MKAHHTMRRRSTLCLAAGALLLLSVPAEAQMNSAPAPDGSRIPLFAVACQDAQGRSLPPGSAGCVAATTGGSGNAASTSNATDGQATSTTNQQNVVYNYLFNGSTWDRMRGSGGFLGVLLQAPLPAGTNVIGAVTQSGGPWSMSGTVAATQSGAWNVTLGAGSNTIGSVNVLGGNSTAVKTDGSATTQPVSNGGTFAVQNTAAVVGGNATAVKTDGSAVTQPVSVSTLPALPAGTNQIGALLDGVTAPGSPFSLTAAGAQTGFRTAGYGSFTVELTGSFVATVTVEGSSDSTTGTDGTWTSINGSIPNDTGSQNTYSTLSAGRLRLLFPANVAPWVRIRVSAYTSGTANAYMTLRSTPFGERNVFVGGGTVASTEANGANAALGSTTDAPLSGAASTTAASLQAEIKGLYNLLQAGTAKVQTSLWWNENVGTSVAANSTTQGPTRSSGGTSGAGGPYGYFTVAVSSAAAGTVYAQCTAGWLQQTANVPASLQAVTAIKIPAFSSSCSAAFVNGGTAGALNMADGFTMN